jgi:hypothetical protein
MSEAQNRAEAQFAAIVEALAEMPGVTHSRPGSRLFGSSSLKVHDKIFAMVSSSALGSRPLARGLLQSGGNN